MKYTLTIDCDNAAFEEYPEEEVARLLREAADRAQANGLSGHGLQDVNGNNVGRVTVQDD